MKNRLITCTVSFALLLFTTSAYAGVEYWNDFLDKAYRYTYHDKEFLEKHIKRYEDQFSGSLDKHNRSLIAEITKSTLSKTITELSKTDISNGLPSNKYLHAAIGQFIEYLRSNQRTYLNNALLLIEPLKPAFQIKKDYHYWFYIFTAHKNLADKNKPKFITTMNSYWRDILIPTLLKKKNGLSSPTTFVADITFHSANLLNLIINKAIIEQKISELYTLGSIVQSAIQLLPEDESYYRSMMNFFEGRETDSANINFTAILIKGLEFSSNLENSPDTVSYESNLKKALQSFALAYSWADTDKGKAIVITEKSKMLARTWALMTILEGKEDKTNSPFFKKELLGISQANIDASFKLYKQIARPNNKRAIVFRDNGFNTTNNEYATTLRQLWEKTNTLIEWQTENLQSSGNLEAKQWAQRNYAQQIIFSHTYLSQDGYIDLIPKSAFYALSENVAKLAKIYTQKLIRTPSKEGLTQASPIK